MQSKLIKNRAKAQQILAFDGLQFGRCRCTDVDLSMDWQGRTFIFAEIKTEGAPLTVGQRIHLQALVDAIKAGGREAYAIVACHQTKAEHDVLVSQCRTSQVYNGNNWKSVDTNERLHDTLNNLYNEHTERKQA